MNKTLLKWNLLADDIRAINRNLELFANALGKNGFGNARISSWVENGDFTKRIEGGFHHMGTTRMSESPGEGVVDGNCKIHGMTNIYITGSSVFATSGAMGPTFEIVSLALRLAEHLKKSLIS